jgi:putative aldouronate transport system permease protein
MVSISDEKAIAINGYSLLPQKPSLAAYQFIFNDSGQILRSYGISIFITVVGTLLSVLITAMFAYPISRKEFKYRNFFAFIVFFTMLFNGGLVPWYMVYSNLLHLKDTLWVLMMPMLLSPFYLLIMKTFFSNSLPDSVIESAKMDGAGEFKIFFSIVLRLSTPALATIGLFSTLGYWNDWFNALMFISKTQLFPLQFLLYRVQASLETLIEMSSKTGQNSLTMADLPGESTRMALCVITIGPIVLAYPFFQKYFIKGLTIGAVKG